MNEIPCTSQNTVAKILLADVCIFDCFGQLLPAAVHLAECRFDSDVNKGDPCFSHCNIFIKNFLLHWNSWKQCSELSLCCCFWLTVSKCSTHFEHSFLIDKCSCKMVNTLPSDIFNSSTISRNFNLWSAKTSLWSFLVFSGTTAKFGWPERSASFVFAQPCLKSAYHLLTVVSDGAESE